MRKAKLYDQPQQTLLKYHKKIALTKMHKY